MQDEEKHPFICALNKYILVLGISSGWWRRQEAQQMGIAGGKLGLCAGLTEHWKRGVSRRRRTFQLLDPLDPPANPAFPV